MAKRFIQTRLKRGTWSASCLDASIPKLVRPVEDHYELIEEVFLDGTLDGEVLKAWDHGEIRLQEFEVY